MLLSMLLATPSVTSEAPLVPLVIQSQVLAKEVIDELGVNKQQFRDLITNTLKKASANGANLYSEAAVELLMLTAAQESHLGEYIRQIKGPARGMFQMEPATEADLWNNYIRYKPELAGAIKSITGVSGPDPDAMESDLAYQILMSRILYLRKPEALPVAGDITGMATYWKKHYNTMLGAGTAAEAAQNYRKYCV